MRWDISFSARRGKAIAGCCLAYSVFGCAIIFAAETSKAPAKSADLEAVKERFSKALKIETADDLNRLTERAEREDDVAQFDLGSAYQLGLHVPQNLSKAVEWYRRSASHGNLGAQFMLGVMYRIGEGVEIDYRESLKWYRKNAEAGDGAAQSELGAMYEHGLGVSVDYKEAAYWYAKAVERGWGYANLGALYQDGNGVPKDERRAVELYLRGAEIGDANSQSNLGVMYATGRGVARDDIEAYKWFTLAIKKKDDKDFKNNRDFLVKRMNRDQIAEGERRAAGFVVKENPDRRKLPTRQ
jgi:TPR repeat protein